MEMCLAWHLPPHVVEGFPRAVQQKMLTFYRWRMDRQAMLQRQSEFEQRAAQQASAARNVKGR